MPPCGVGLKCPVCFVDGSRRLVFRVGSILRRAYRPFQNHRNPGHYSDRLLTCDALICPAAGEGRFATLNRMAGVVVVIGPLRVVGGEGCL